MPGALKVKDQTTGLWVYAGTPGPMGPSGPTGPQGVATTIVGEFVTRTSAELPVDGAIPADWDGVGTFPGGKQMAVNEALIDNATASATFGNLWQFVGAADAAGWIDVGQVVGPVGSTGPSGSTGPTGPPTDEIHIGPDTPPLPVTELWYDTDDARTLGPYFLPDGGLTYDVLAKVTDLDADIGWRNVYSVPSGKIISFPNTADVAKIHLYSTTFGFGITGSTLNIFSSSNIKFNQNSITGTQLANISPSGMEVNAGHLYFPTDGHGVRFNGNGYVYKKVGSGMKLRKSTGNPNWQIENNDGGGAQDIVTVSGGQNLAHNQLTLSNYLVISGSNGSNSKHVYVDCDSNNNGYYFNVLEARRLNLTNVFQLKGYISDAAGDAHAKMYVNLGSEGIDEVTQWADYGDGQVCILCHGPMSATHFQDRNLRSAVAGTQAPINLDLVGRLIDAVQPITFARHFRSPDATDANPEGFVRPHHDPIPTLGLDLGGCDSPYADRLRDDFSPGSYSLGGMLAVAVAEIKSLRARVAQLEGAA